MSKCENILNSIYCLSQEASSTMSSLRSVSCIAKNIDSYRLYVLLEKLHANAIEAFMMENMSLSEEHEYIEELFFLGSIIKDTYKIFSATAELPCDNIMLIKLEHQIKTISSVLSKLEAQNRIFDNYSLSN